MIENKMIMKDLIKAEIDKTKTLELNRLKERAIDIEKFIESKNTDEIKYKMELIDDLFNDRRIYLSLINESLSEIETNKYKSELREISKSINELKCEIDFSYFKIEKITKETSNRYTTYTKLNSIPLNELFHVNDGFYDAYITEEYGRYFMNVIVVNLELVDDHINKIDVTESYLNGNWESLDISLYINQKIESKIYKLHFDDGFMY